MTRVATFHGIRRIVLAHGPSRQEYDYGAGLGSVTGAVRPRQAKRLPMGDATQVDDQLRVPVIRKSQQEQALLVIHFGLPPSTGAHGRMAEKMRERCRSFHQCHAL